MEMVEERVCTLEEFVERRKIPVAVDSPQQQVEMVNLPSLSVVATYACWRIGKRSLSRALRAQSPTDRGEVGRAYVFASQGVAMEAFSWAGARHTCLPVIYRREQSQAHLVRHPNYWSECLTCSGWCHLRRQWEDCEA